LIQHLEEWCELLLGEHGGKQERVVRTLEMIVQYEKAI
jgi:hypothetical protein